MKVDTIVADRTTRLITEAALRRHNTLRWIPNPVGQSAIHSQRGDGTLGTRRGGLAGHSPQAGLRRGAPATPWSGGARETVGGTTTVAAIARWLWTGRFQRDTGK